MNQLFTFTVFDRGEGDTENHKHIAYLCLIFNTPVMIIGLVLKFISIGGRNCNLGKQSLRSYDHLDSRTYHNLFIVWRLRRVWLEVDLNLWNLVSNNNNNWRVRLHKIRKIINQIVGKVNEASAI